MSEEKKIEEEVKDDTQTEVELLQQKCDEYLDGWKRAKADYSNLKKDQSAKHQEIVEYAHAHILSECLEVYNNFKMAAAHKPASEDKDWQNWASGIDHIQKQFQEFLKKFNIEEIKTVGSLFDPLLHESMGDEVVEGKEQNEIIKEIMPGYTLNGKVVVVAKVIISK